MFPELVAALLLCKEGSAQDTSPSLYLILAPHPPPQGPLQLSCDKGVAGIWALANHGSPVSGVLA